jgi:hypothetical protein
MNADDFLVRDYELKVRYLTDHFQRMWTRFNFFVTIESALIGGKFIFGGVNPSWPLALLGTALSFIWYIFGAEDRYLVRVYREQVEEAGKKAGTVWPQLSESSEYTPVGKMTQNVRELLQQADRKRSFIGKLVERVSGWRYEPVSTTRLAALFPLFVFAVWLGVLVRLVWKWHVAAS